MLVNESLRRVYLHKSRGMFNCLVCELEGSVGGPAEIVMLGSNHVSEEQARGCFFSLECCLLVCCIVSSFRTKPRDLLLQVLLILQQQFLYLLGLSRSVVQRSDHPEER